MEKDGKRLQDEVVTLKTAIEEAINKGQKSPSSLNDIPTSGLVSNEDLALARMSAGSKLVGGA